MALRYLLDTNILSSMIREPGGPVTARIVEVGADAIATSIVAAWVSARRRTHD